MNKVDRSPSVKWPKRGGRDRDNPISHKHDDSGPEVFELRSTYAFVSRRVADGLLFPVV